MRKFLQCSGLTGAWLTRTEDLQFQLFPIQTSLVDLQKRIIIVISFLIYSNYKILPRLYSVKSWFVASLLCPPRERFKDLAGVCHATEREFKAELMNKFINCQNTHFTVFSFMPENRMVVHAWNKTLVQRDVTCVVNVILCNRW